MLSCLHDKSDLYQDRHSDSVMSFITSYCCNDENCGEIAQTDFFYLLLYTDHVSRVKHKPKTYMIFGQRADFYKIFQLTVVRKNYTLKNDLCLFFISDKRLGYHFFYYHFILQTNRRPSHYEASASTSVDSRSLRHSLSWPESSRRGNP